MNKKEMVANPIMTPLSGGGGACNPLIATVSGLFGKFTHTGCGFAKKGIKLLGHWGSNGIGHSEALAEESLLKGAKLLRHYGTKKWLKKQHQGHGGDLKVCSIKEWLCHHAELVSASVRGETLKQVQGDNVFVYDGKRVLKKCAFTLSEVLIVLAVLGVIAAMTIPDLIQDYREKALITALKKSYTVFSQAVDMATAENGPPNTWDIGTRNTKDGALKLYNILAPYLKIEKECETSEGCFASSYKALFNSRTSYPPSYNSNVSGVLVSGASFFTWTQGTGCYSSNNCGLIGVDVNGSSGPNQTGVDYFLLSLTKSEGLQPYGLHYNSYFLFDCEYNNSDPNNGLGCTWWAIKHENMDYLRKAGTYTK